MPRISTLVYPELAAELARSNLTQAELAEAAGCTQSTISNVLRGYIRPTQALRSRIAAALGRDDVDTLFTLSDDVRRLVADAVAQGHGETVDDAAVLRRIATLARRDRSVA